LPIAGATAMIGVSPAPAEGRSLRSSSTMSIGGTSPKRGRRYCESPGFGMRPPSNSTASHSAPPSPITTAPSTWLRSPSGFTIAPHSNASTMRPTRIRPLARSTSTSAHVAT